MNITLFTSDSIRHKYLIKLLSSIADKIFVIQESRNRSSQSKKRSKLFQDYFKKVNQAELKIFSNIHDDTIKSLKNIKIINIPYNDLYTRSLASLAEFLKSDIYITYGCSYIREGELLDFLIKKKNN